MWFFIEFFEEQFDFETDFNLIMQCDKRLKTFEEKNLLYFGSELPDNALS